MPHQQDEFSPKNQGEVRQRFGHENRIYGGSKCVPFKMTHPIIQSTVETSSHAIINVSKRLFPYLELNSIKMIYNRNEEHFFANPATEIKINLNEMKNYEHAMYR